MFHGDFYVVRWRYNGVAGSFRVPNRVAARQAVTDIRDNGGEAKYIHVV